MTHDENPANKQPYAHNNVDVPWRLVGCEYLHMQEVRPCALVWVNEWAMCELHGGVVCSPEWGGAAWCAIASAAAAAAAFVLFCFVLFWCVCVGMCIC